MDSLRRKLGCVRDFGALTTVHGLSYINTRNRHPAEVWLWVLVTSVAGLAALALIGNNWRRYSANPTVLSLDKNYRAWRVPFPAATVCLLDRVNRTDASALVRRVWGIKEGDTKFGYYMRFVQSVGNLTYDNLQDFDEFKNDVDLYDIDMANLASKVQVNFTYTSHIFNPALENMTFKEIITEMGICYTYSGVMPEFIHLRKKGNGRQRTKAQFKPPYCNFLNSQCYAVIEDLPGALRYYVHSPYEIPDMSSSYFLASPSRERDTSFTFLETGASRDLRSLEPRQRQCRFPDEPTRDIAMPVYSYNLCRMSCRQLLARDKCGCAPYFYMPLRETPVCTVKGLSCLAAHAELIGTLLRPDGSALPCPCALLCTNIDYFVDKNIERNWSYPVPCNIRFRWAVKRFSKTKVRRDIIFGFEDLLVSFGGTAAFFLGCSVITFVELIYFITLKVISCFKPANKSIVI